MAAGALEGSSPGSTPAGLLSAILPARRRVAEIASRCYPGNSRKLFRFRAELKSDTGRDGFALRVTRRVFVACGHKKHFNILGRNSRTPEFGSISKEFLVEVDVSLRLLLLFESLQD